MNFRFTTEQNELRTNVQHIAKDHIEKELGQMDKGIFPTQSINELARQGMMGIPIPREYGGLGKDYISYIIAIHELSKISATVGVILSVHTSVGTNPILYFGTNQQKETYIPKLASGEYIGAFALTEPNAGSDAASLKLKAVKQGKEYILDGSKMFITNGLEADTFITFARTSDLDGPKGISAFIIEKETLGLTIGKTEKKMGILGSSTVSLHFDHCKVPATQLLGEEGQGFQVAMANLNGGRIGIAAQALGIAESAYEHACGWVKRFSNKEQNTLFKLAEMATKVEAAKALVYRAAFLIEEKKQCIKEVSMAKLFATRTAREATTDAIQILGLEGCREDSPLERYFRDAKVTEIYEGTSEIQRIVIAKQLFKS